MGYQKQAISGLSWVTLYRAFLRGIAFIRTAILARILTPTQFGVYGIASIFLGLMEMFTETGINVFLIQEEEDTATQKYLDTAYVVSILRGLLIALFIVLLSPLVARFFNSTQSLPLLLLIALVPLVRGFINPSEVNFQKQLKFNQEFWFRALITLADGVTAISLALILRSAVSLIWGLLAGAFVEVILSHLLLNPKPRFRFNKIHLLQIIHRGKWITLAGIFAYFSDNGPDMAIGKLLNAASLGYYQMASRFSQIPIGEVTEIFNRVTFPIYAKITGNRGRAKNAFYKHFLVVLGLVVPFSLSLFIFATPITQIVLGDPWLTIVPYLKLLSLLSIARAINGLSNPILLAVKKQAFISHMSLIRLLALGILIIPFTTKWGIIGAIYADLFSILVMIPPRFITIYDIIKNHDSA